MFEITYNDADALERYEKEKRAYPGAKYDFTFEKRFLVYHVRLSFGSTFYLEVRYMINLENSDNFKSWDEWEHMKKAHYGTKTGFQMIGGIIDFDPDKQKDLVGGDKLTYVGN